MNKGTDFVFPVSCYLMKDGIVEIVTDEAKDYIGYVKRVVSLNLTMQEYGEYLDKKGFERDLYLRKKVLEVIQK